MDYSNHRSVWLFFIDKPSLKRSIMGGRLLLNHFSTGNWVGFIKNHPFSMYEYIQLQYSLLYPYTFILFLYTFNVLEYILAPIPV